MTDANRCPSCGAERPEFSSEGLCPRCLLQDALDTEPPSSAGTSVLASLAGIVGLLPRVLLRDDTATGEPPSPVLKPSSPEMPELPDRSARLQLFGEIARGGMGAILRGRDIDLGRDLAVKVLLEAHQEKPELVRRFIEEAQIGGQLQHPGVVPVYELGAFADRRPYFTMKLVKGRGTGHRRGAGRLGKPAALGPAPGRGGLGPADRRRPRRRPRPDP
jgi:eukaryotic-like serine/threonine-protein kinase